MLESRKYYLGPKSWPQWLLALLPFSILFNEAAKKHDDDYGRGGDEIDKILADDEFYDSMLKKCSQNSSAYLFAYLYAQLVFKFGYKYFNYIFK